MPWLKHSHFKGYLLNSRPARDRATIRFEFESGRVDLFPDKIVVLRYAHLFWSRSLAINFNDLKAVDIDLATGKNFGFLRFSTFDGSKGPMAILFKEDQNNTADLAHRSILEAKSDFVSENDR